MCSSKQAQDNRAARERELLGALANIDEFAAAEEEDLRREVEKAEQQIKAMRKANDDLRKAAKERKIRKNEVTVRKASMVERREVLNQNFTNGL